MPRAAQDLAARVMQIAAIGPGLVHCPSDLGGNKKCPPRSAGLSGLGKMKGHKVKCVFRPVVRRWCYKDRNGMWHCRDVERLMTDLDRVEARIRLDPRFTAVSDRVDQAIENLSSTP